MIPEHSEESGFMIQAKPQYLVVANTGAFLLGALIFFLVGRIPLLFSPLAVALLIAALGLALGAELAIWLWRGVRAIVFHDGSLDVEYGPARRTLHVEMEDIAEVSMARGLRGRRILIFLKGVGRLGFAGKRLSVPAGVFSSRDFTSMFSRLKKNIH
jgi:hypothetical protein